MECIQNKVDYWNELWKNLIQNNLKNSYGLSFYSPSILVQDIIVEIEENQFRNKENKKYFYSKIGEYLKSDKVIKTHFKSEFSLLQKNFYSENSTYLLALCKKINITFKNGIYFKENLNFVSEIILEKSNLDLNVVNKLRRYSQNLIVELIQKSYHLDDIKKFIDNIFADYSYRNDKLVTDFPHNVDFKKFRDDNNVLNVTKVNDLISKLIDNLTLEDRIKHLDYYYNKKTENVKYIFYIKGLKGKKNRTIAGVSFYDIESTKHLFNKEIAFEREDLQRDAQNKKFTQVTVDVDYLLPKSSLKVAKDKIEIALDLLTFYFPTKTNIRLNESRYLIIDNDNNFIYESLSREKNHDKTVYIESLNLDDYDNDLNKLEDYNFLWSNNIKDKTILKIKNALHWYRKGKQTSNEADKILNFWIAIETLFNTDFNGLNNTNSNKFSQIQKTISERQVFIFIYNYGWELYYYFKKKVFFLNNQSEIPDNLIKSGQLRPREGEEIHLQNFIAILPELKNYESNLFYKHKIDSIISFYNDSKCTKNEILQYIEQVKNDVLLIYRFRNLIVHNAHFDNNLLPYFVWKSRLFCKNLLVKFISSYEVNIPLMTSY